MSTQHHLTIVEVPQPPVRRTLADRSVTARNSSTKRTRLASEGKSAKKRIAAEENLSRTKAKGKVVARPAKSGTAAQKPLRAHANVDVTTEPVLPVEVDIPFAGVELAQPQPNLSAEENPAVPEPALAHMTAAEEESPVQIIEKNVQPELELSAPEHSCPDVDVIAEPQPIFAAEAVAPGETRIQTVLLAKPQSIRRTFAFQWNAFLQVLAQGWNWLHRRVKTQQAKKRLRVCESVSLGEKRFIAVVQVDGEQFLVGGSSTSVSTLAHLEQPREFSDVLRRYGPSGMQA